MSHITQPILAILVWAAVVTTLLLFLYLAVAIYRAGGFRIPLPPE